MIGSGAHGWWSLVRINALVFIFFALNFAQPRSGPEWRSFGACSVFMIALFSEMYGFPLTIYPLSGWLGRAYPELDPFSHQTGHLLSTLIGWLFDPHLNPLHWLSDLLILGGVIVHARSWRVLHRAQVEGTLATGGPYARVRHPQYAAFVAILLGFLLQWPTLLTLVMFPVLVSTYVRLARREEAPVRARFGAEYAAYAARTPAFLPRLARARGASQTVPGGGAI